MTLIDAGHVCFLCGGRTGITGYLRIGPLSASGGSNYSGMKANEVRSFVLLAIEIKIHYAPSLL